MEYILFISILQMLEMDMIFFPRELGTGLQNNFLTPSPQQFLQLTATVQHSVEPFLFNLGPRGIT